jgi:Holliday junction resolvase
MTTSQKRKGSDWERQVTNFLSDWFPQIERRMAGSIKDKGDLQGIPYTVIECKNTKKLELAAWTDHLFEQMENAGAFRGVVIAKRPRKGVSEAYAIMPLVLWAELLKEATNGTTKD